MYEVFQLKTFIKLNIDAHINTLVKLWVVYESQTKIKGCRMNENQTIKIL